jgi:hypothetical protein
MGHIAITSIVLYAHNINASWQIDHNNVPQCSQDSANQVEALPFKYVTLVRNNTKWGRSCANVAEHLRRG